MNPLMTSMFGRAFDAKKRRTTGSLSEESLEVEASSRPSREAAPFCADSLDCQTRPFCPRPP
ncbi:MAG: hypothetical protein AUK47_27370 [Deltaproteobacteria bacterium CG2_30_63_29]|nr:MAG: hypothetical protein AUK47_27370 [Deltaproteobacteria bacterium CG2_30_63_29]